MNVIGNFIWLILGGIIMSILWAFAGLLLCITIIFIPLGFQCFKIAGFILWPFGRDIMLGNFGVIGALGNILWIIICGIELCIAHLFFGLLLCITIIGIPFGLQNFKLAKLALIPFGAVIYTID